MNASWRTSLAGLAVILGALASAVKAYAATGQVPDMAGLVAFFSAISTGVGLMHARDNKVTSEQAGAGLPKIDSGASGLKAAVLIPFLAGSLVLGYVVTGCTTSQERKTYNADATAITTATAALDSWATYYVSQKRDFIAKGNQSGLDSLEKQRILVNLEWKRFQNAASAIILGQQSAFANTNSTSSQVTASLAASAQPLIALVNSFLKP